MVHMTFFPNNSNTTTPSAHSGIAATEQTWTWLDELPHIERDLRSHPRNATHHHWMGVCLHELGRFAESLHHLVRSNELDPHDEINKIWIEKCRASLRTATVSA